MINCCFCRCYLSRQDAADSVAVGSVVCTVVIIGDLEVRPKADNALNVLHGELSCAEVVKLLHVLLALEHQDLADEGEPGELRFDVGCGDVLEKDDDAPDFFVEQDGAHLVELFLENLDFQGFCEVFAEERREKVEIVLGELRFPLLDIETHFVPELAGEAGVLFVLGNELFVHDEVDVLELVEHALDGELNHLDEHAHLLTQKLEKALFVVDAQLFDAADDHLVLVFLVVVVSLVLLQQGLPQFFEVLDHHFHIVDQDYDEGVVHRVLRVEADRRGREILAFYVLLQQP